jgi:hypothetical protein
LALFVKIRIDHLLRRLDEMAFKRRLRKATLKYGGGENIPPEVVGELLGNTGDDYSLVFAIHLIRVCERLGLEPQNTILFDRTRWMIQGTVPPIEDRIYTLGIIDELAENPSPYAYAVILRELINNKDTSYAIIHDHFKTHEEYTDFMRLCGRE